MNNHFILNSFHLTGLLWRSTKSMLNWIRWRSSVLMLTRSKLPQLWTNTKLKKCIQQLSSEKPKSHCINLCWMSITTSSSQHSIPLQARSLETWLCSIKCLHNSDNISSTIFWRFYDISFLNFWNICWCLSILHSPWSLHCWRCLIKSIICEQNGLVI